jgi:hypothetical protein
LQAWRFSRSPGKNWMTRYFTVANFERPCIDAPVSVLLAKNRLRREPPSVFVFCFFRNLRNGGTLRGLDRCRPLSGIPCRSAGTAHRIPIPMNRSPSTSTRPRTSTPTRPETWHAHPCLRGEQPASQNTFRRLLYLWTPKNPQVKIEVSLRGVYSLLHALFASLRPPFASTKRRLLPG